MQVYRDLRILTARPTDADETSVPHALYGGVDGETNYSVSRWLVDVRAALERAKTEALLPIFVGGTGLYFKALTQGLSDIPPVSPSIRAEVRAWADGRAPCELHAELTRRDPITAARLRPTDPQRLIRALEVNAASGESLAAFQSRRAPPTVNVTETVAVFLAADRAALRMGIDQRFDEMMAAGALDEVRRLAARDLDRSLPVMRAHGVPPLLQVLDGAFSLAEAITAAKADTRRYVKRQETFVRNQLPAFEPMRRDAASTIILSRLGIR